MSDDAEDQVKNYLKRDLGEHTVAFATDGIRWKVFARPEKEADIQTVVEVELTEAFAHLPSRHKEQESYNKFAVRQTMSEFEMLARENVERQVSEVLSDFG